MRDHFSGRTAFGFGLRIEDLREARWYFDFEGLVVQTLTSLQKVLIRQLHLLVVIGTGQLRCFCSTYRSAKLNTLRWLQLWKSWSQLYSVNSFKGASGGGHHSEHGEETHATNRFGVQKHGQFAEGFTAYSQNFVRYQYISRFVGILLFSWALSVDKYDQRFRMAKILFPITDLLVSYFHVEVNWGFSITYFNERRLICISLNNCLMIPIGGECIDPALV